MSTKLTVATALAGTLLATCLVSGSAQATSLPVLKGDVTPGVVTLVGKGGGRGGGGGGGMKSGGGGGGHAMRGGGGGGYKGGGGGYKGGGGGYKGGGKSYAYKGGGGGYKGGGGGYKGGGKSYAYKGGGGGYKGGGKSYAYKDGDKRHAYKDRDHDHDKFHHRHRVFRNGVWVWVYGPGYTAYGDDCYWLRRQAIITGSPYWWDRYNACVGYDYF
jgi:hypothetical protein